MPLPGLILRDAPPLQAGLSSRADVALFVGLVPRRPGPLPRTLLASLEEAGWAGAGPFARQGEAVEALLDLPVPVTSFDAFERLFAWDERPVEAGRPHRIPCALGLAVRSFFEAGGAQCWILRTGDPLPLLAEAPPEEIVAAKRRLLDWAPAAPPADAAARVPLLPGSVHPGGAADPNDPRTWRGVAHVFGVEEAVMLALPDLPELLAGAPEPLPPLPEPPPVAEVFKPCAPALPTALPDPRTASLPVSAPRLDRDGYRDWAAVLRHVLDLLATARGAAHRRDVMLVASLPLASRAPGAVAPRAEAWPMAVLDEPNAPTAEALTARTRLGSARLQLAYPWVETAASAALPEAVEGAEGVLMGTIARVALARGAFRSAAGTQLTALRRTLPELGTGDLQRGLPDGRADWLGDRLCLIGQRSGEFLLLSDATMAADRAWRAGGVSRLMGIILRAARWLGQDRLFEPAGPPLWASLRLELESFLDRLRDAGALAGATPEEAYTVRCDATTMTQADIDAGRTIATLAFTAAQPIERIAVTLALGGGAGASLRGGA